MNPALTLTPAPSQYRDRKRYAWLFSVLGPGIAVTGPVADYLGHANAFWYWLPLLFFYVLIPTLDALLGEDRSNPVGANVPALEADNWIATVLSTGAVLGFGLNVSHELGHKKHWLARKVALFNTALGGKPLASTFCPDDATR